MIFFSNILKVKHDLLALEVQPQHMQLYKEFPVKVIWRAEKRESFPDVVLAVVHNT